MKLLRQPNGDCRVPFLYSLVEPVDEVQQDAASLQADLLRDSYDPDTQTSTIPVYAGSFLTYDSTYSGLFGNHDDKNESDT